MIARRTLELAVFLAACGAAIGVACTSLPDIPLGVCGNAIVERNADEECDTFPLVIGDASYPCADAGAQACHVTCGTCPPGWGCGTDAVCREPSGTFAPPGSPIEADIRTLALADFNSDGRLDVVTRGSTQTTVYFFDQNATLTTMTTIDVPRGEIALGAFTDAGASLAVLDTVLSTTVIPTSLGGTGIELWQGQPDHSLATMLFKAFPIGDTSYAQILPTRMGLEGTQLGGDDILVFGVTKDGPGFGYFSPGAGFFPLYAPRYLGNQNPAGEIPTALLGPSMPCDSAVVGFPLDFGVYVFQTCRLGDGGIEPNDVSFPDGGLPMLQPPAFLFPKAIEGPLFLFDYNGDGNLDVVTGAAGGIEFAPGDGAGNFGTPQFVIPPAPALASPVLAVADIDGDGTPDYVDSEGVVLTTHLRIPASSTLTAAYARDLNDDGTVDVVGISSAGVDFYSGTGTALMNHDLIDVAGATTLAVGDVDGDFNQDIIVGTSTTPSTLYVLYGQYAGYPLPPATIGSASSVEQLACGKLTWFFGDIPDDISSIAAVVADSNGNLSALPIQGHADRQLTSPFILSRTDGGSYGRDLPVTGTIGNVPHTFIDGGYDASLVVLGASFPDGAVAYTTQLWTVPATTADSILTTAYVPSDASASFTTNGTVGQAGMVAVDLDPSMNNGDEIVLVTPNPLSGTKGKLAVLASDPNTNQWSVLTTQDFDGHGRTIHNTPVAISVQRGDFDGDGLLDILVVHGDVPSASGDTGPTYATVYFNTGNATMLQQQELTLPPDTRGAAPIRLSATNAMQIAVLSDDGVTFYSFAQGRMNPTQVDAGMSAVPSIGIGQMGTSGNSFADLAVGDVNGDGVDDLVIATPTEFVVLRGIPEVQ